MKIQKKSIVIGALALTLALVGVPAAQAATASKVGNMGVNNLASAIATKFNLNATEVQQVFTEQHVKMEANRVAEAKTRLAADVTAGKITQAQADLITAKRSQLEASRVSMEGKTKEEAMATMKTERTALEQWAKDNNIPASYIIMGGRGGGHKGFGREGGMKGRAPLAQ